MLKATYEKKELIFHQPAGTSRGILDKKETWIVKVFDNLQPEIIGTGECGMFRGLSFDDMPEYELMLNQVCKNIDNPDFLNQNLQRYPSIKFGIEMALLDLKNSGRKILFPSDFTRGKKGIRINGLIWMHSKANMLKQIELKLDSGFRCLKLKIGAIDLDDEIDLLHSIRKKFSPDILEIRLDANGAFEAENALQIIEKFAPYHIHSIEQPIQTRQYLELEKLCKNSPVPVTLDEELIGIQSNAERKLLLERTKPSYIVLKPTLVGGFEESLNWIKIAEQLKIGWWVTSALESNIALNAIAQWVFTLGNPMVQGLGTGNLYQNNFPSSLKLVKDELFYIQ